MKRGAPKDQATDISSGTCAEFYVMAELLRRGIRAYLTMGNHKQVDILVRPGQGSVKTLDVKAIHGPKPDGVRKSEVSWDLKSKVEQRIEDQTFLYVLVWMGKKGDLSPPEYFVVPSRWAAMACRENHEEWARGKSTRDGQATMRRLKYSQVVEWKDRWELLK